MFHRIFGHGKRYSRIPNHLRLRGQTRNRFQFQRLEDRKMLAADFIISEFLASNDTNLVDDNGNQSDWIEIHNKGTSTGNLSGYTLTDDAADPAKFVLPSINVPAGAYLIVFAADDANPNSGSSIYTGFGLKASGEYVGLYNSSGNVVSEFGAGGADYPTQYENISYGVKTSGNFDEVSYFSSPSPRLPNRNPINGVSERVFADVEAGFKNAPIQVSLSTPSGGATIRYTVDGSTPSATNGLTYTGPVSINSTTNLRAAAVQTGGIAAPARTWSYLYLDDILTQSTDGQAPPGWPTSWGFGNGNTPNEPKVVDYGVDPDIINAEGLQNVKDALLSIPSWSITTDLDNLFDETTGIYSHAQERGRAWERPASVELINPDGSAGFQVNAGLRIKGAYSRRPENPKNSLKLYFRDEYGDSELNYPVHGSEGTDTFKKLDLRTAQNWSWSFNGVARANYIEDELARITQRDLGQPYTRSVWFHMYLNGQYWGIYQTQERHDSNFAASYFGGDPDDYDVIKAESGTAQATDGNLAAWHELYQQAVALMPDNSRPAFADYANYMKAQGLNTDGTRNPNYKVLLDVDNLIDYMTIVIQGGNRDAPIGDYSNNTSLNNVFWLRDRNGDEGFKFFAHDSEHTMLEVNRNRNGPFNHPNFEQAAFFNPQTLHQKLMANAEYRLRFADRVEAAFSNGGPLSVEGQIANIDALAAEIDSAIIGESLRWGDAKRTTPRTRQTWLNALDNLRNNYLPARIPVVLQQFRDTIIQYKDNNGNYTINADAPLLPDVDAPDFLVDNQRQHGGQINIGDALSMDAEGLVYYTTDGSDPRLVGGNVAPEATGYNPSTVTTTAIAEGSAWRYNDSGSNLGTAWRQSGYNDNSWSVGNGELGYGDGDEDTTVSFGGNASNKHVTTYFRKDFNAAVGNYTDATLRLLRDDGAVVYLNGVEVLRTNMPSGTIGYTTLASAVADNDGKPYVEFSIDPSLLIAGNNTLAVEIHQISRTSSDISFDAELVLRRQNNSSSIPLNGTTEVNARVRLADGSWSALTQAVFFVNREAASGDNLRLTEINYNPANPDAEYLEFQNISSGASAAEVDLGGVIVTDGPSAPFVFAEGVTLDPQAFGVIVSDVAAFTAAYPSVDPSIILGTFVGKLSNSGEKIRVEAASGDELFDVTYADNQIWGVAADGLGASLELTDPAGTPADATGKFYHWQSGTVYGGTPGQAIIAKPDIVINEVFANSDAPNFDYIELLNRGTTAVNIGNWYLSDNDTNRQKFRIPADTIIEAGGHLVFDERSFNPAVPVAGNTAFALSSSGDEVWLSYGSGSQTRFVDNVEFSASAEGQSYGLVPGSSGAGAGQMIASATRTPGAINSAARVSSVVISEVNYHPDDPTAADLSIYPTLTSSDLEFIELTNTVGASQSLSGWRIRGESDIDLPALTLASNQSVVVVSFNPEDPNNANRIAAFRNHYGISSAVNIVGGFSGSLSNSLGRIALQRPDGVDAYVLSDEVMYDDTAAWPLADGTGSSINRIAANLYGNASNSWTAAAPTPGAATGMTTAYAPEVIALLRDVDMHVRPDLLGKLQIVFDSDVSATLNHFTLVNDTLGGMSVSLAGAGFSYDPTTFMVSIDVSSMDPSLLDAGFYSIRVSSQLSGRTSGLALDGNGDGNAGDAHTQSFYLAIPGDANLDGDVDISNFNILTQADTGDVSITFTNLDSTAATWGRGDFNGDGDVDITQFNLLQGTNVGDVSILYSNLYRNVRPSAQSPAMTVIPVASSLVTASPETESTVAQTATVTFDHVEPVSVEPTVVEQSVEEIPADVSQNAFSVESATSVSANALGTPLAGSVEGLVTQKVPLIEPLPEPLSLLTLPALGSSAISAAEFFGSSETITVKAEVDDDDSPLVVADPLTLTLSGSLELLDDAFSDEAFSDEAFVSEESLATEIVAIYDDSSGQSETV